MRDGNSDYVHLPIGYHGVQRTMGGKLAEALERLSAYGVGGGLQRRSRT